MPASRTAAGWASAPPGAGITHTDQRHLRPDLGRHPGAARRPNGVSDQLLVNGQARLAGTALAIFQPGSSFGKSYTLLTATSG